jgi:hypothetical protein
VERGKMLGQYRLIEPILAMFAVDGRHETITVPTGSMVDLNGKTFNGDRLTDVLWNGKSVMMFTEDLRNCTVAA